MLWHYDGRDFPAILVATLILYMFPQWQDYFTLYFILRAMDREIL